MSDDATEHDNDEFSARVHDGTDALMHVAISVFGAHGIKTGPEYAAAHMHLAVRCLIAVSVNTKIAIAEVLHVVIESLKREVKTMTTDEDLPEESRAWAQKQDIDRSIGTKVSAIRIPPPRVDGRN